MIDTNTVSYIVKGNSPAARAKLARLGESQVASISAITEGEIQYGLAKTPNAHVLQTSLETFFARIRVLPWGREEALAYGALRSKLEASGKILGNLDMLIAAHAIATGAILVTNDRAFLRVKDIARTENWANDL